MGFHYPINFERKLTFDKLFEKYFLCDYEMIILLLIRNFKKLFDFSALHYEYKIRFFMPGKCYYFESSSKYNISFGFA